MATFKSTITTQGSEMLTRSVAEKKEITISNLIIGSGRAPGNQATLTEIITPVTITAKITDRTFIPGDPSMMEIAIAILNIGLLYPVPVREIGLFADDGTGEVLFSYTWLDGADTDNIVPVPINPDFSDTSHAYRIRLFITEQENANINVSFALTIADNELIKNMSDRIGYPTDTASNTGLTVFSIIKWIANKFTSVWTDVRAAKIDTIDENTSTINTKVTTINTNLNTINTNVGTSTNPASATSTTLFGLIKYIVSMFTGSWTTTRAGYLDNISTRAAQTTANSILDYVSGSYNRGNIKIVQRGQSGGNTNAAVIVNISPVNLSKAFTNIPMAGAGTAGVPIKSWGAWVVLTSSTTVTITPLIDTGYAWSVPWEIVESY